MDKRSGIQIPLAPSYGIFSPTKNKGKKKGRRKKESMVRDVDDSKVVEDILPSETTSIIENVSVNSGNTNY